jgi:glycosyltransferase involved in cell wall biosynthesis
MSANCQQSAPPISGTRAQGRSELVSVIIPCYRQAHFLGEAIQSVLGQTHPSHEIVVVDDGSPDNTREVASRFPGVRYIRQTNQGLAAARNTGIRVSTGTFLVFLDADDRLLPQHFATCLNVFRLNPKLALVCGDYRWFGAEGLWHVHSCSSEPDHYAALLRLGFIYPPHTAMVRRSAMLRLGGFRTDLPSSEDRDCWLRLARLYPIHCHHQLIAEYRRHDAQMSRKWDVMLRTGIRVLRSQWPYVKGKPAYEEAYRQGIQQYQTACGPPLSWQTVEAVRRGDWRRMLGNLAVLVRYYPQGIVELARHKLARVLSGGRSQPDASSR